MIDLMMDIETLGKKPGVVVLDVAIVPFHINGTGMSDEEVEKWTFRVRLNMGEQVALGYVVDPETLEWWSKQDPQIRLETFSGTTMLDEFREKLLQYMVDIKKTYSTYRIWDTAFDKVAVEALFPTDVFPFFYRNKQCLRTLTDLAKVFFPNFKKAPTGADLHAAVADCKRQIQDAISAYALFKQAILPVKILENDETN